MTIIRDMLFGMHQFSDFLRTNPGLSSKVLSERLKDLEEAGFIIRKEMDTDGKSKIEYHLTERGVKLKRVLYALSMFGAEEYPEEVFGVDEVDYQACVSIFGNGFKLEEAELEMYKSPEIEEVYSAV